MCRCGGRRMAVAQAIALSGVGMSDVRKDRDGSSVSHVDVRDLAVSHPTFESLSVLPEVVIHIGTDGLISWVSPTVTQVLGWQRGDLIATEFFSLIHPEDISKNPTIVGHNSAPAASASQGVESLLRWKTSTDSYRWMTCVFKVLDASSTMPAGIVVTAHDVNGLVEDGERAKAASASLQSVMDTLHDPHVILDPVRDESGQIVDFVFAEANQAACESNARSHHELVGARLLSLHPAAKSTGLLDEYINIVETGEVMILDDLVYPQDLLGGVDRHYEVKAFRLNGSVSQTWRDITERQEAITALARTHNQLRLLLENTMDLVLALDMRAIIDWVSPSIQAMLGYTPDELIGTFAGALIEPEDLPRLLDAASRARAGESTSCRVRMVSKTGDAVWVEATPRPRYDDHKQLIGGVVAARNIDKEVEVGRELEHEIDFDSLTGLAKTSIALRRITDILGTRRQSSWALLCVGVNGMRAINQAFTYTAGDDVLRTVAARLVVAAGAHDRVARIAGDEFVVLLSDVVTPADAGEAAQRIITQVHGPLILYGTEIDVSVCVGVAMAVNGVTDAPALLRDASSAMRHAASLGPNQ